MTDLFAKRRARLLALKALRDGQSHPALDNTLAAPCPACGAGPRCPREKLDRPSDAPSAVPFGRS